MDRSLERATMDLAAMSIDLSAAQVLVTAVLRVLAAHSPAIYAEFACVLDEELEGLHLASDEPETLLRWLAVKAVAEDTACRAGLGGRMGNAQAFEFNAELRTMEAASPSPGLPANG